MSDILLGHLIEILKLLLYAVFGAIIMGISLGVFLRLLQRITPLNEWEELKKGNMAVAVYFGAALLALGLTIMASILTTTRRIGLDRFHVVVEPGVPEQDVELLQDLKPEGAKGEEKSE